SEFSNFAKLPDTPFYSLNVVDVISQSIEVYNYSENARISFQTTTPTMIINGSKDHLMRILNNLIKNALEAIPAESEGQIDIKLVQENEMALITVSDNGRGIPEDLEDKIFNPNFTTKSSGTGLGLAFVKQAVENMLGSINFTTQTGRG